MLTSFFPLWSRCRQGIAFPPSHMHKEEVSMALKGPGVPGLLCCAGPRRSYWCEKAGWLFPCQCLRLVLQVSVPERLGEWLSLSDCLHAVHRSLAQRAPSLSQNTSGRRFLFSPSLLLWVHSTALFWSLGKRWGGDRAFHHRRKATRPYWVVGKVLD